MSVEDGVRGPGRRLGVDRAAVEARLTTSSEVGTATHRLIAAVAASPGHRPDAQRVTALARRTVGVGLSTSARQTLRAGTISMACVYFARFWTPGMRLIGCEVVVQDQALDLLWQLPEGQLLADEIKTGLFSDRDGGLVRAQVEAQLHASRAVLGPRLRGVRAVLLRRPGDSFELGGSG